MKKLSLSFLLIALLTISSQIFAYWPPSQDEINKMIEQYKSSWSMPSMPSWENWPNIEELQKQWEAQWLAQIKKSIISFRNSVANTKKQIEKFEKQWGVQSQTLKDAMIKTDSILSWIDNATTITEAQTYIDMIDSVTSIWNDEMEKMAMTWQIPSILKRADNELSKLQNQFNRIKNTKKIWDFDISWTIDELQKMIDDLTSVLSWIKSNYKTDPAKAIDDIQNNFFDKLQETWQFYGSIQALQNIQSATVAIVKTTKICDEIIKKAETSNIDTKELVAINEKMKSEITEFVSIVKNKIDIWDIENITAKLTSIMQLKDDFDKVANKLNIWNVQINPLDSYIPSWAFSSEDMNNISKWAVDWTVLTTSNKDKYAEVLDAMNAKIIKAVNWLWNNLDKKFNQNNTLKIKFLDWILVKIDKVLLKSSLSEKNVVIYTSLKNKILELKASYEANFTSSYDDIINSDIKDLLKVD